MSTSNFKLLNSSAKGLTLLELILVIVVLGTIVILASPSWRGSRIKSELDSDTRTLVDTLKRAQNNATTGEGFTNWGVRFDNTGPTPFFQLFSGPNWTSGNKYEYFPLTFGVMFASPASGAAEEITFDLRTGKRTAGTSSIVIRNVDNTSLTRTIYVSSEGAVSTN
ncbi:MAG: hypothetical protein A3A80_00015 [Candidatus Terrybacteria bacterium RIFCSPLOWO2_01_FULL_44_24]|nr:MAG: hypothetical protein A3B75_02180 [Candidatus Terrybacteria bacterium RIFCSPHIGHO2_02_FULL_43_14]OHA51070.1 MAG: hypothetical protein A3A80_00015 [Candidatus Terrybacteria bacterium RIFCSPLOWO2_01_FULL_44_24]